MTFFQRAFEEQHVYDVEVVAVTIFNGDRRKWMARKATGTFHFQHDGVDDCNSASLEDGESSDDENTP